MYLLANTVVGFEPRKSLVLPALLTLTNATIKATTDNRTATVTATISYLLLLALGVDIEGRYSVESRFMYDIDIKLLVSVQH